ncbi:site-specific integrase [Oscillibacter valericigenes]|uniref:site-specific integrase n=1 Tax=Oscillibacter valericigenes TaxID=351091 RepID=UPI001F1F0FEC|nr:site-specific integrase [Oscillibacter valericigenes]MCF2617847.1 site-specific integrase [Oscillibacter valericigenes]
MGNKTDRQLDFSNLPQTIDGKFTFFGVLNNFYYYEDKSAKNHVGGISRNWKKDSTLREYKLIYENTIFPFVPHLPLEDLTKDDFDKIIEEIKGRGSKVKNGVYTASRLQTFRRLIKVVTEEAAKQQICDDVLYGSSYTVPDTETWEHQAKKEHIVLRKSFTIREEINITRAILRDCRESGQEIGLAFMFCLGLRNEEACGLNWGDIIPMQHHPGCYCLWIYKSTRRGTNQLQAGGKTKNMARMLPIPSALLKILEDRKTYMLSEIDAGHLVLPPNKTFDQLPIVCSGSDFLTRCSSSKLTAAGRKLLKKVEVPEAELAYIDIELEQNRFAFDGVREKDPTVYLCRRNLGTHLYILGLEEPQIQYILGHDIQDPYASRNDYANEDKLYEIKTKLDRRPLVNMLSLPGDKPIIIKGDFAENFFGCCQKQFQVQVSNASKITLLSSAIKPQDQIRIRISVSNAALEDGRIQVSGLPAAQGRTIDISTLYQSFYRKVLNRIPQQSSK